MSQKHSKMCLSITLILGIGLLSAVITNNAQAVGRTPSCALFRSPVLPIQAKKTKDVHIDMGDTRVTMALDLNLPIPNGPYIVKTLASALKEHPDARWFSMEWSLSGPTSGLEYGVRYDRYRHNLSFLSWGFGNEGGPSREGHFWYRNVSDKKILKITLQKKLSAPFVSKITDRGGPGNVIVEDSEFLPWFHELKRQGCPCRKLKFNERAMSRIRLSDTIR